MQVGTAIFPNLRRREPRPEPRPDRRPLEKPREAGGDEEELHGHERRTRERLVGRR